MKQIILLLCCSCLISIASCRKELENHVKKQTKKGNDLVSFSTKRICRIYSKITGNHIRIKGKRIDARGTEDDKYTKMEISSLQLGGRIAIRGVESNRYLCMNKKGRLVAKVRRSRRRNCDFIEGMTLGNFGAFRNLRHPKWYIGFHSNGKPKRGNRVKWDKPEGCLLKRDIDKYPPPTPSQSFLRPGKWRKFNEFLRRRFNEGKKPIIGDFVDQLMVGDDPGVLTELNPPDIQEELDKRKKAILWKRSRDNNFNQSLSTGSMLSPKREPGSSRRRRPKDRRRKEHVTDDAAKTDVAKKSTRNRKSGPRALAFSRISRGSSQTSGGSTTPKHSKRKKQAAHKRRSNRSRTARPHKSRNRDSTSANDVT